MANHDLPPGPNTVHWGGFSADIAPALTVDDGDVVRLRSLSGGPAALPPVGFGATVDRAYASVHDAVPQGPGPHLMTGPVFVRGAEPGDALRVEILDVRLKDDWGFNLIRPLAGALPDDFPIHAYMHVRIDVDAATVAMPWGLTIPAAPFFGVMGVAPPPLWGMQTSIIPRRFGGNIDCRELGAGATLFLPVMVPGALFSAGDGHAVQGDGEVCLTAVETGLEGDFRLSVAKGLDLDLPRAETETHLITLAFDPDLDRATVLALRAMVALTAERAGLSPENAYRLCSLVADVRISQVVNQHKGVHVMMPKWAL